MSATTLFVVSRFRLKFSIPSCNNNVNAIIGIFRQIYLTKNKAAFRLHEYDGCSSQLAIAKIKS